MFSTGLNQQCCDFLTFHGKLHFVGRRSLSLKCASHAMSHPLRYWYPIERRRLAPGSRTLPCRGLRSWSGSHAPARPQELLTGPRGGVTPRPRPEAVRVQAAQRRVLGVCAHGWDHVQHIMRSTFTRKASPSYKTSLLMNRESRTTWQVL